MSDDALPIANGGLAASIGSLIRRSRLLAGWSQRELGARARTSQATVWRIETGQPEPIDLSTVERLLDALGLRATLHIDDRIFRDRERQIDGVHAWLNGAGARWLRRLGWDPKTEVQLGSPSPTGWIDTLAWREEDRSLLVEETKTDVPDMGGLQRRTASYVRDAREAAERMGWSPMRITGLVIGLDSRELADRLRQNRDLVSEAFPSPVDRMTSWLRDPSQPPPRGWTFAVADPASRAESWLRAIPGAARRRPSAYRDYSDALIRMQRRR